jgi:hypothetical protein
LFKLETLINLLLGAMLEVDELAISSTLSQSPRPLPQPGSGLLGDRRP